jgi:hypothetical protein
MIGMKQVLPLMLAVLAGCAPYALAVKEPTTSPPTPARS